MRKLFSLFAALTLSVGLWAANSVITFTSTGKLYPVIIMDLMMDNDKWAAFKVQYPEFANLQDPFELMMMGISSFNPNAFLDANDQVLTFTIDYDESTHAGTITVNGELVKIGGSAFENCGGLTSITLPEGVTSIASRAFSGCAALTSITLPEGVTSIGEEAFSGCALTSITLPEGVTSIEPLTFYECTALTSVILPESLSSIGTYCFVRCSLSSVTIPANVTYLGNAALGSISSLTDVYVAWTTTLPTLEGNATFYDSPIGKVTLHVLAGSKELYQDADVWKDFESIVEYDPLPNIKTAAIAEINAAIDGVTDEAILAIATTAITNINNATTKEAVNTIKTQALADIAAAIFAKYKADAIAEIQTAGQGIQNTEMNNWINGAITDINAAGTDTQEKVDNIKNQILSMIQLFQDGKTEGDAAGYQRAKAELPTEGTTGPAVTITKGDKTVTFYNTDKVEYSIVDAD